MKKIEKRMREVLDRGEKIFLSGVPVGYPDIDSTRKIVEIYIKSGVDVVEFSMPSMDPYIDTQTIAESNVKALRSEPELKKYFEVLHSVRQDFPDEPFYMMAYADVIRRAYFLQHPYNHDYLLSIKDKAKGFVLLQSVADAQGKRPRVAPENKAVVDCIRQAGLEIPIILGYGINNPERVKEAVQTGADGIIVGTAMIERITGGDYEALSAFIRSIKDATLPA
jgi:tryptophan synthase alpha chain